MEKKYSLALGGGASRGFVHIGVLKYIEENNIQINEISGTSMGAVIGALWAIGKSSQEIEEIAKTVDFKKLIDIDLSFGLIKGKKILKKLEDFFGDEKIENTKIPLKIVATNLETGEKEVFEKGKITEALRASISLPGVFVPYKIGKSTYIDGGVVNNLPIDVLKGENVIGVSALKIMTGPLLTKKKIWALEINPGFIKYNYDILHRTITLMMKQNETQSIKNLKRGGIVIVPEFGDLDFYHFSKIEEFTELGYNETEKKLKKLLIK